MVSKLFSSISILLLLISSCLINGQFLRIDTFDDATCSTESFASQYIKLDNCVGQYIYKFVPSVGAGTTTTTGGMSTLTGMTGPLTSMITTAGTLSGVDITSIVTQAITLGMTGGGNLNVAHLESVTGTADNSGTQSPAFSTATAQAADSVGTTTEVVSNPLTSNNAVTTTSTSTSNEGTTTEIVSNPLTSNDTGTTTSTPTSNEGTTTSTPTSDNAGTTSILTGNAGTTNPLTSASGSILTNSGSMLTTAAGVTQMITNVISASLTTSGTATGNVQGGQGTVIQYYCLSVGCAAQCVALVSFPIGICTQSRLDNVVFSIAHNLTGVVTKIDDSTNPGVNNGFCQTFSSPNACITTPNEIAQFKNDHCGKGMKTNCTSNEFNNYKCVDAGCKQCSLTSTVPLNSCILNNNTGSIFKSLLKTPIVTVPSFNSSESKSSSEVKPSSSDSVSMFTSATLLSALLAVISAFVL